MSILNLEPELDVAATAVRVTDSELVVELEDGRTVSAPLAWYPRLQHGTPKERQRFEIEHDSIHWPDLDEDISTRGLLLGRRSGEGPGSLNFWLTNHRQGRKVTLDDYMKHLRKTRRETKPAKRTRKSA